MRVVAARVQETAERVLHRPRRRRVDVTLDCRQVHDVLAKEEIGNVDAFGIDAFEHAHSRRRLVGHPCHVAILEVVQDRNIVLLEDGDVVVQVLSLESIGDDRLVLHAHLVGETAPRERLDRPFELPRRRVRRGKRKMPGDIVLENRRLVRGKRR